MNTGSLRWFEIDLLSFDVCCRGFSRKPLGHRTLYHSPGVEWVSDIEQIRDIEYAHLIIVDPVQRTVCFGRDYLGHYPLTYASVGNRLYISDNYAQVHSAVRAVGGPLTVSEEALALYFTMGFVPHGLSVYKEILNCEATGYYIFENGKIRRINLFQPVPIMSSQSVRHIGEAIETEVARYASQSDAVDVWCSGGLDSSIMAMRFNAEGRQANLLTLAYGETLHQEAGDGERRFACRVAEAAGAQMLDVELAPRKFEEIHALFVANHNAPVLDFPLPPKYALAEATRDMAITGEAGDTFFGGTKNAFMAYAAHKQPEAKLGRLYAIAHDRYFHQLGSIFKHGEDLSGFAEEHCEKLVQSYPGDLQRKLFYLNSHEKLGSMIFAQSYFPSMVFGKRVRHPLASLGVYRAAFSTPDHRKFSYPFSKITLNELYRNELPPVVVWRKKSGTQLPLAHYLDFFYQGKIDFSPLAKTGYFREELLEKLSMAEAHEAIPNWLIYAFFTLNLWLKQKEDAHAELVPAQSDHHAQSRIAEHV